MLNGKCHPDIELTVCINKQCLFLLVNRVNDKLMCVGPVCVARDRITESRVNIVFTDVSRYV